MPRQTTLNFTWPIVVEAALVLYEATDTVLAVDDAWKIIPVLVLWAVMAQTGGLANAEAKVTVQPTVDVEPLPTVTKKPLSVPTTVGPVPQADAVGMVPVEFTWPVTRSRPPALTAPVVSILVEETLAIVPPVVASSRVEETLVEETFAAVRKPAVVSDQSASVKARSATESPIRMTSTAVPPVPMLMVLVAVPEPMLIVFETLLAPKFK